MTESHAMHVLKHGWKKIFLVGLVSAVLGLLLSLVFPLEYSSSMRLLIIQKQLAEADPYTAIKASERIADNLGQIIYTTSFYDKVMGANFNVDVSRFSQDPIKRRKQWQKMIGTQVLRGSGLLVVTVYNTDKEQATQLSRAIAFVLTTEGYQYIGGGDLQVKLVDEPLLSRWPVRPNIPANAVTGFVLGLIVGSGYLLATSERRLPFGLPRLD